MQLLDYPSHDVEDVFCLAFEETVEVSKGVYKTLELKPGGSCIPVTAFNRAEYVSLFVNFYLYGKCAACFDAYKAGFLAVCGRTRLVRYVDLFLERFCTVTHSHSYTLTYTNAQGAGDVPSL
jgi:hypothetical protein